MDKAWYFNEIDSADIWGPTVNGVGTYELPEQKTQAPLLLNARTLDTYALVFLVGGQGSFKSPCGGQYPVSAGSAFWLFPNEPHNYGADKGDSWKECWILLSNKWMRRLEKEGIINRSSPVWQVGLPIDVQEGFSELFELCQNNPPMLASRLSSAAAKIIFYLHMVKLFPALPDETAKIMNNARKRLKELIEVGIPIEQIAEETGFSTVHFRRLFRQTFGQPVGQYILDLKIKKAQQLMATGLPIKEVSQQLNFANVYYFTRIFKKKTSLPPHQWLKSRTYGIPKSNNTIVS